MQKSHKIISGIILGIGGLLLILIFSGACGKKEGAPEKPKVVSKKVVSKKISKPAPSKVKQDEADASKPEKVDTAAKDTSVAEKSKQAPETSEKQSDESGKAKEVISETKLSAKKKPAINPKSEISNKDDYKTTKPSALTVAKKEDLKTSASTKESAPEDDSSAKQSHEKKTASKEPVANKANTPEKQDKKEVENGAGQPTAETNSKNDAGKDENIQESPASEEPEPESDEHKKVAKLEPSKTLAPVKIDPLTPDFKYKPEGKIDPFSSLFKVNEEARKKRRTRFPLTPLEKVDISQFKLVGVILSAKGNKAIVQEASGKGYVVSKGTYIGVNEGRVVKILKDRIICEEEVENLFGEIEIQSRTLKLNKPAGAL